MARDAVRPPVRPGRSSDGYEGEVVVFLIGMRVNSWLKVRAWWPVFTAMPKMLAELAADPTSGLLGHRMAISTGGPVVIQYWASSEQLISYAKDAGRGHRPAWQQFNARARTAAGAVGLWHETFVCPAGAHETIYEAMPVSGLAAATTHVPLGARGETADERLAGR